MEITRIEPAIPDNDIKFTKKVIPKPPFRFLLVAPSGKGKTNFLISLIIRKEFYRDFFQNRVYIFSKSILADRIFTALPRSILSNSFDHFDIDVLASIFETQKNEIDENGKTRNNTMLIVLDDFIQNITNRSGPPTLLEELYMRGRHYNISIIITSQMYMLIPKPIRLNCTALVLFEQDNVEELVNIYKENGSLLSRKAFISRLFSHVWTKPYQFLFIDKQQHFSTRYRINFEQKFLLNDDDVNHFFN
jgi:hypothetical protein